VTTEIQRLVVVSNRLPVVVREDGEGKQQLSTSPGGLVTALSPILRQRGGLWIGWPGAFDLQQLDQLLHKGSEEAGYQLRAVELTEEEVEKY
jgi:trehalose-6-phosphate synthase